MCTALLPAPKYHDYLVFKLLKQGYSKQKLKIIFFKFIKRHQDVIIKYHADILEHIYIIEFYPIMRRTGEYFIVMS